MADITYRGTGANDKGLNAIIPGLPTGWQPGDLHLLMVQTANQAVPSVPTGFTLLGTTTGFGTAGTAGSSLLTIYYRFAQTGDAAPTVPDSGNHQVAVIGGFIGVDTTTPFDVAMTQSSGASSTAVTFPNITTLTDKAWVVQLLANPTSTATNQVSANSAPSLTSVVKRYDVWSGTGVGGGVGGQTGIMTTAGLVSGSTVTLTTAAQWESVSIALRVAGATPIRSGAGSSDGVGVATGAGASTFAAAGTATGAGFASGVVTGLSTTGAGSSAGAATVLGQAVAFATGTGTAAGSATVTAAVGGGSRLSLTWVSIDPVFAGVVIADGSAAGSSDAGAVGTFSSPTPVSYGSNRIVVGDDAALIFLSPWDGLMAVASDSASISVPE